MWSYPWRCRFVQHAQRLACERTHRPSPSTSDRSNRSCRRLFFFKALHTFPRQAPMPHVLSLCFRSCNQCEFSQDIRSHLRHGRSPAQIMCIGYCSAGESGRSHAHPAAVEALQACQHSPRMQPVFYRKRVKSVEVVVEAVSALRRVGLKSRHKTPRLIPPALFSLLRQMHA